MAAIQCMLSVPSVDVARIMKNPPLPVEKQRGICARVMFRLVFGSLQLVSHLVIDEAGEVFLRHRGLLAAALLAH